MGNAIVNRLPSVVNGASFFGDRGLVSGTTLGTIGGGVIWLRSGGARRWSGMHTRRHSRRGLGGEIGFFGAPPLGMVGGGAYGAVTYQMQTLGRVAAQAYRYATTTASFFGTGVGTIAGGIAGPQPAARPR